MAVLAAVIHSKTYQEVMLQNGFVVKSYNYIVYRDGQIMLQSPLPEGTTVTDSFIDLLTAPPEKNAQMKADLKSGVAGSLDYSVYGERRLFSYVPTGIKDWTLASIIPNDPVAQKSQSIMHLVYTSSGAVMLAFALLLIHVLRINKRNKIDLVKLESSFYVPQKSNAPTLF